MTGRMALPNLYLGWIDRKEAASAEEPQLPLVVFHSGVQLVARQPVLRVEEQVGLILPSNEAFFGHRPDRSIGFRKNLANLGCA